MITSKNLIELSCHLLSEAENSQGQLSESFYRSSGSKAYYSAFHSAKDVAESFNSTCRCGGGVHKRMIDKLINTDVSELPFSNPEHVQQIGVMLNQLKPTRTKADYHLDANFSKREAELAIETSKYISEITNKLLQDNTNLSA